MDSGSKRYTLVEVLSREAESSATTFDITASRAPGLVASQSAGIYRIYDKPFSCAPQDCTAIDALVAQDRAILFEFTHGAEPGAPLQLTRIKCSAPRETFRATCL